MLSIKETLRAYSLAGKTRTTAPALRIFLLGILAGFIIACGGVAASVASFSFTSNPSLARLLSALVFPIGLGPVLLTGAELFTGNCMLPVSVLDKNATLPGVLRNWLFSALGNFVGAAGLALLMAGSGALQYGDGALAAQVLRQAAAKCSLLPGNAFLLGVGCNILVCLGVLCGLSAHSVPGRIMGAYLPVFFFVIAGFEHSVANMYSITVGLLVKALPQYATVAAVFPAPALTPGGFARNLLFVMLGNIVGGGALGLLLWVCHAAPGKTMDKM